MQEQEPVNFYLPTDDYGEFSNIYPSPFTVGTYQYATNEHFFQSKKFEGKPKEQYIISAPTPDEAFDRGNQRTEPLRPDWAEVKETVMRTGLKAKFTQNPKILEKLLSTGNRPIVEHTENDSYWGDGGDGTGKNRLGLILMELRQELRQ